MDTAGDDVAWLHRSAASLLATYEEVAAALVPKDSAPPEQPDTTPRLAALGPGLPESFDAATLARALRSHPVVGELAGPQVLATEQTWLTEDGNAPVARALEVLGGPEDGRRLVPQPGHRIGRAGGDAQHALYARPRDDGRVVHGV